MSDELLSAIQAGDLDGVNALIERQPDLVNARASGGLSAVSTAMYHGKPEIARALIDRGAAVDFFDACAAGAADRVRELAAGTGVNSLSPDGFPALALACFFGHEEIARYLLDQGADPNVSATNSFRVRPIHAATARRSEAIVRLLLERGADPNARQQNGYTPLHSAAQNGDGPIIALLLQHGADPTLSDDSGRTPADLAPDSAVAGGLRR
jgi:ankyrin repeat protein